MKSFQQAIKSIAYITFFLCLNSSIKLASDEPNPISILTWNIESPGSNPDVIAQQLEQLMPFDILSLSEVPENALELFTKRWGQDASLLGTTGGSSRLMISWNPDRLECLGKEELKSIDGKSFGPGNQIAPLVVHLRSRANQFEFKVMMNKLHRGSDVVRKTQALLLCDWGKQQTIPCFAVGGYNFDYDFKTKKGNAAFDAFMNTDVWHWIEPNEWLDNNWADNNRDGKDDYPDSMLDFAFVTPWNESESILTLTSEVIQREGDFPDTDQTSDFRPMRTTIEFE